MIHFSNNNSTEKWTIEQIPKPFHIWLWLPGKRWLYSLHSCCNTAPYTLHTTHYTLHNATYSVCSTHYTVHTSHCILLTIYSSMGQYSSSSWTVKKSLLLRRSGRLDFSSVNFISTTCLGGRFTYTVMSGNGQWAWAWAIAQPGARVWARTSIWLQAKAWQPPWIQIWAWAQAEMYWEKANHKHYQEH